MDTSAELAAVLRGVLIRPAPDLGTLVVAGPDRQGWLSGQLSCEVKALGPGQGAYGLSLSRQGRIQAEVWVAVDSERVLLGLREDLLVGIRERMSSHLIMEDAEIAPAERPHAWWLGYGPHAEAMVQAGRELGAVGAVARLGHLDVALVVAPPQAGPDLVDALCSTAGSVLATAGGWEQARLEHGLPRLGVDFAIDDYPHEAALERLAVSFTKGCYLGQEVLIKLERHGHPAKRLVRLVVAAPDAAIAAGAVVSTPAGEEVGTASSAADVGGRSLAFAMVPHRHAAHGTALSVRGHQAVVADPPLGRP